MLAVWSLGSAGEPFDDELSSGRTENQAAPGLIFAQHPLAKVVRAHGALGGGDDSVRQCRDVAGEAVDEVVKLIGGESVVDPAVALSGLGVEQIADKWSLMVMAVLEEPRRFNEIKRRLEGVTQRVLTQTLRRLERNGMVVRTVLPTSPVGVEYSLTPMGYSLREPFSHLYWWTVTHAAEIQERQVDYDRRMEP